MASHGGTEITERGRLPSPRNVAAPSQLCVKPPSPSRQKRFLDVIPGFQPDDGQRESGFHRCRRPGAGVWPQGLFVSHEEPTTMWVANPIATARMDPSK